MVLNVGVRFLPLYTDALDDTHAFLDTTRYLLDPDHVLVRACREPFYVPETATLDKVLVQFQDTGYRVAMVVDEYGGTAGIITRGDILDELTGEIADEFEEVKPLLQSVTPNRWMADGNIGLEELNERMDLALEEEGVDRIAGWIAARLERMPHPGDQVEEGGYRFTVKQMRRNRVVLVEINRLPEPP